MRPFHLLTAGLAAAAAVLAANACRTAQAAMRAADGRRRTIRVSLAEGRARRTLDIDTREYALRIRLQNDSAALLDVTALRLRVTYLTRANFLGIVDLEPTADSPAGMPRDERLLPPLTLAARTSVAGWLFFRTRNVIPRHCRVDDYTLLLTMGDGRRVKVDAALPAMLAADTDGAGAAAWGWD